MTIRSLLVSELGVARSNIISASYPTSWWTENFALWLLVTKATINAMIIIVTVTTTITATTPPTMMAAVLSDCPATVVLSVVVVIVHCGSPKELMMTEQLLSTFRRTPCTAMVESVWATKVSKYANSNEVLVWAVPQTLAQNVTCRLECSKHWNAPSVMHSALSPHWHTVQSGA